MVREPNLDKKPSLKLFLPKPAFQFCSLFVMGLFCLDITCHSQNIPPARLDEIGTDSSLPYVDKDGHYINDRSLENYGAKVIFYSFTIDRATRTVWMKGRVINPSILGDTVGEPNFISLATPKRNRLTNIRSIGQSFPSSSEQSHPDRFPFRMGDFSVNFRFNKRERLYFDGVMTFLIEYNIAELLKSKP
jgi:hypothetical protein